MSSVNRFGVGVKWTVAVAAFAVLYYRAFKPLLDMAKTSYDGPFTAPVTVADNTVPIFFAVALTVIWIWVFVGGVQKERSKIRRGPPP